MPRTVLISGGSGGVGHALARKLAGSGYRPVVGFRHNRAAAEALAAETGGLALALDLSAAAGCEAALAALDAASTAIGAAVLMASPSLHVAALEQQSYQDFARHALVAIAGHGALLAALIRRDFRPNKSGTVIAVSTSAVGGTNIRPARHMSSYIAAKSGLEGLVHAAQADYPWLRTHILAPSYIETPMLGAFDSRFVELLRAQNKLESPDAVAADIVAALDQ